MGWFFFFSSVCLEEIGCGQTWTGRGLLCVKDCPGHTICRGGAPHPTIQRVEDQKSSRNTDTAWFFDRTENDAKRCNWEEEEEEDGGGGPFKPQKLVRKGKGII